MNIFEQYGIKEVADVTIYAIDLDKYDDEIYIPIMYLDTLKVSTLEQSASETFARGGLGNANLIAWDFGKEISLNIQDALFTPASQSLMWGGKYGIKKPEIYGVFNPYVYPKDSAGKEQYIRRVEINTDSYCTVITQNGYWEIYITKNNDDAHMAGMKLYSNSIPNVTITRVEFDENNNQIEINNGDYIGLIGQDLSGGYILTIKDSENTFIIDLPFDLEYPIIQFYCPCDSELKSYLLVPNEGQYLYVRQGREATKDQLDPTYEQCPAEKDLYESIEEPVHIYKYTIVENELDKPERWVLNRPEIASFKIDKFGTFDYDNYSLVEGMIDDQEVCYYQKTTFCDSSLIKCTEESIDASSYTWLDSNAIVSSFERTQATYYLDNANIRFRVSAATGYREIGLSYYTPEMSDIFSPKIDIFKTITQKYKDINGLPQEVKIEVLVGTFYAISEWNVSDSVPQDLAYLIDSGLSNVDILESMTEVRANQTFAIDSDKNLRCYNYRNDSKYDQKALTIFINPKTMRPYEANSHSYTTKDGIELSGNFTIIKQNDIYYKWTRKISDGLSSLGHQIIVDSKHYPGTFKIVGKTFARSRYDGQDEKYQFEIPLCKLSPNTNITLEAAGDPTTFSMNFSVLRKDDGTMIKLIQYGENPTDRIDESEIPNWEAANSRIVLGRYRSLTSNQNYNIINPNTSTTQFTDIDKDAPLDGTSTGHLDKADKQYIDSITSSTTTTWPQGSSIQDADVVLTTQEITPSGQESLNINIDKVLVEETALNQIQQQEDIVYDDGTVVHTDNWINVGEPIETTKYLTPEEYALEAKTEANS